MKQNFLTLFNPDANYDFVGRRRNFYALSVVGILVSIVALATLGFNRGIDFKGGTKLILAFQPDAAVDRAGLQGKVGDVLKQATGQADIGQYEVQEFDTGSGGGAEKNFAVTTELTSVVGDAKRDAITKQIQAAFGQNALVEWAAEGEDRVFVTLQEPAAVPDTYGKLRSVFEQAGFPQVKTSSDVEVQLDVNLYRSLQLSAAEGAKTPEQLATEEQSLREQKLKDLEGKKDSRYSVVVQEFKSRIEEGVRQAYGPAFIGVQSSTAVSPSVAGEMLSQGLVAILYAILGIVLYIILRFDVRYAPGALVATFHDVILVIGAFSIAQVKFSMPVIAAILTVAGYSINDTIVIFDRIREMMEKHPDARDDVVINAAINTTMSRSVLTSLTTAMAALAIFLFGGGLIRDFAFALCIGIIVGAFSSIFVAAPMFLYLHRRLAHRKTTSAPVPATAT